MSFKQLLCLTLLLMYGNVISLAGEPVTNNQPPVSDTHHSDNNLPVKKDDQASASVPATTKVETPSAEKPVAPVLEPENDSIQDPTQMTGSFTQALGQMQLKASNGSGNTGGGKNEPMFPVIELVSKKISGRAERVVLLAIDGKRYQAKTGGKFSCLWNNIWLEIEINTITKDEVEITINPMKKKITLY